MTNYDLRSRANAAVQDRLECGNGRSTFFTYDRSEPSPASTIETALGDDAADSTVVQRSRNRVLVDVERDGKTVEVLIVNRWRNGGWAVEAGGRCRR